MGLPAFCGGTDKFYHPFIFPLGDFRPFQVVAISLVDHNGVRQFHNPLFDALQIVPCACQYDKHKEVDHIAYCRFRLPDPDSFHKDDIVACRFTKQHSLTALAGYTAQRPLRRRRTYETVRFSGEILHTCLVP